MSSARGSVAAAKGHGDVAIKDVAMKTDADTTDRAEPEGDDESPPSVLHAGVFRTTKARWRRYSKFVAGTSLVALTVCLAVPTGIRSYVGCQSPNCESWIEEMSRSIDASKKPCDNFYDYVCGRYASASGSFFPNAFLRLQTRIFLSFYKRIMLQDLDTMREEEGEDSPRFKAVYMTQQCLHEALNNVDHLDFIRFVFNSARMRRREANKVPTFADVLKEFLNSYNLSWPPDKQRLPESLLDTLVELSLKRDIHVLFHLQPDKDFSRPGFHLLHWDINIQGVVIWLLVRGVLMEKEGLENAFRRSALLLTGRKHAADITPCPLLLGSKSRQIHYSRSNRHSVAAVGTIAAGILLEDAISLQRKRLPNRQLTADDRMIVKNKFMLPFVSDIVLGEHSGSETAAGYVAFLVALQLAPAMASSYLEALLPSEALAYVARLLMCLIVPNQQLSYAMVDLFVDWFVEDGKLAAIRAMSVALWNATESVISDLSWIDDATRKKGLEHIRRLGRVVGHPFNLSATKEQLRQHYAFVPRLPASHADMFTVLHDACARRRLALLKAAEPSRRHEDAEQPMILVNAFYVPIYHWVFIMDGIMFAPFYTLTVPESVNYGALGHVVGHEVTHSFDPVIGIFNASGLKDDWWSPVSRKLFDERIQCLRDLYNTVPWSYGIRYGDSALSENFADCGGMEKVLRALRQLGPQPGVTLGEHRFTAQQAFFVSSCFKWCSKTVRKPASGEKPDDIALLYSPLDMRCNVPLMNTPAFAEAFSCASGTLMNPKVRCELF
ncbi:hypothetical protein HPB50_013280 [Hyalomma asiaticum]|uniref:Uncharacterized protein n=1 Tax=Hyalomma asiaticum TaxID=266040 RepID=A0ACB7T458_HYAAI|nr:hypothetical protein HPB50_013280 [Hyalomma asiaticum]